MCWFGVTSVFAQSGGKAEPKRIHFAEGKISATLTGTLSNSQEMEYVFSAAKGSKVEIVAETTINRRDFGVNYGNNLPSGIAAVSDSVRITLQIEAGKAKVTTKTE